MRRSSHIAVRSVASLVAAACLASTAATLAGATTDSSAGSQSSSESATVKAAQKALAKNYAGTDYELPPPGPKPQADKSVFVIACGLVAEGCATPAKATVEAGELVGWKMTLFDGKLSPDAWAEGVRTAVAADADAIVFVAVDCAPIKSAIQEAKKAGVLLFSLVSFDCDDQHNGKPLFDASAEPGRHFKSLGDYFENQLAPTIADYAIAKTRGNVHGLLFRIDDNAVGRHIADGIEKRLKRCASCTLDTVDAKLVDLLNGGLQAKASAALPKYPDANVVFAPFDAAVVLGIAPAVIASGRDDDIILTGVEGLAPNVAQIKDGKGQDMAAGQPSRWAGWASIDELIRLLAGQPQVKEGIGWQTVDRTHNLPTATPYYDGNSAEYEAYYRKAWGVSG